MEELLSLSEGNCIEKQMTPSLRKIKKKTKKKPTSSNITPLLGIHSKWEQKVMQEIKPPFSSKEQKQLKKLKFQR